MCAGDVFDIVLRSPNTLLKWLGMEMRVRGGKRELAAKDTVTGRQTREKPREILTCSSIPCSAPGTQIRSSSHRLPRASLREPWLRTAARDENKTPSRLS